MSWLQFTDAMVGHLAWPIVVVIALVMLRKHLGALADRLSEFGFGGATVKFDRLLSKGRGIIAETSPAEFRRWWQQPLARSMETPRSPEDRPASRTSYVIGVLQRWRATGTPIPEAFEEIEAVLEEIGEQLEVKARNGTLIRMLITRGLVTSVHLELYNTLRRARDAAAHDDLDPTFVQYKDFTFQAAFLVGAFKGALDGIKADKNKPRG